MLATAAVTIPYLSASAGGAAPPNTAAVAIRRSSAYGGVAVAPFAAAPSAAAAPISPMPAYVGAAAVPSAAAVLIASVCASTQLSEGFLTPSESTQLRPLPSHLSPPPLAPMQQPSTPGTCYDMG